MNLVRPPRLILCAQAALPDVHDRVAVATDLALVAVAAQIVADVLANIFQ